MSHQFNFKLLDDEDRWTMIKFIGDEREPDLVIAPDGNPYLYRWWVTPPHGPSNVYCHVQVDDDPERPLHDHPWDNTSVILSGGYKETISPFPFDPSFATTSEFIRQKGDVIFRKAPWPHRLELLDGCKYAMTLFVTGPKIREWGFWYPDGWRLWTDVTKQIDGNKSIHIKGGM